jgi:chemotaxis protein MotA
MAPRPKSKSSFETFQSGAASFSIASLVGALFSFSLVIGAIAHGTQNFAAFLSLEGVMIVVGGTLAVAFMSYQASDVVEALRGLGLMFKKATATHENFHRDLINVIGWARVMKEKGMRGLENVVDEGINDPFVRYGLEMVVSNYEPDEVRAMMETAADAYYERDTVPAHVLMSMAGHAPAFGMVGTLIGMVIMLGNFGGDMSGIGEGLSVALLATLYGVVSARLLYMPAASKIMQKQENLRFRNHLITEGMSMMVANKSPRYIHDRLNSFLKPGLQSKINADKAPMPAAAGAGPKDPPVSS